MIEASMWSSRPILCCSEKEFSSLLQDATSLPTHFSHYSLPSISCLTLACSCFQNKGYNVRYMTFVCQAVCRLLQDIPKWRVDDSEIVTDGSSEPEVPAGRGRGTCSTCPCQYQHVSCRVIPKAHHTSKFSPENP